MTAGWSKNQWGTKSNMGPQQRRSIEAGIFFFC